MPYYIKKKKNKESPSQMNSKSGVKVKRKPDLVKKLDRVFSEYIRLRDATQNGYIRCIACGQIKPYSDFDAGHYYSRRHMSTRFDEDNVQSECKGCNRFKSDHLIGFRENLIRKIGQMRFDKLAWKANQSKKWTDFELSEMIKYYSDEVKNLKMEKGYGKT